jgi:hypothetical protein
MIGRALNYDNDIILEKGNFKLVKEGAEVVQHVRTRLLTYVGEWFLDIASGTPWFEQVFVKPANLANVESIIKTRILQTEGVLLLNEFSMSFESSETRRLTVSFKAETKYGSINVNEVTINV